MIDKIKNYALIIMALIIAVLSFILYCQEPKVIKSETVKTKTIYIKADTVVTGATNATILPSGGTAISGLNLTITNTTTTTIKEKDTIKEKYSIHGLAFGVGTYLQLDPSILSMQSLNYNLENWSIDLSYINDRDIFSLSYNHIHAHPDLLKISYQKILILF